MKPGIVTATSLPRQQETPVVFLSLDLDRCFDLGVSETAHECNNLPRQANQAHHPPTEPGSM